MSCCNRWFNKFDSDAIEIELNDPRADQIDIGIREQWVERGWTRQQMLNRINELGLYLTSWCHLQPYELNFLQDPEANEKVLAYIKSAGNGFNRYVNPCRGCTLWTKGESINIVFNGGNTQQQEVVRNQVMTYLQPLVSMKFNFVNSGGNVQILFQATPGTGGSSDVGKPRGTATVRLDGNTLTRGRSAALNWAQYLVLHEFGHLMGLMHEYTNQSTPNDIQSIMNYPAGSSGGDASAVKSSQIVSTYSQKDKDWLMSTYKGSGETIPPSIRPTQQPPKQPPKQNRNQTTTPLENILMTFTPTVSTPPLVEYPSPPPIVEYPIDSKDIVDLMEMVNNVNNIGTIDVVSNIDNIDNDTEGDTYTIISDSDKRRLQTIETDNKQFNTNAIPWICLSIIIPIIIIAVISTIALK